MVSVLLFLFLLGLLCFVFLFSFFFNFSWPCVGFFLSLLLLLSASRGIPRALANLLDMFLTLAI